MNRSANMCEKLHDDLNKETRDNSVHISSMKKLLWF